MSVVTSNAVLFRRTFLENVELGCFLFVALNQIVGVFDPPEAFFLDPQAYAQDANGGGADRPVPITTAISHFTELFVLFLLARHSKAYLHIIRRSPLVFLQVLIVLISTCWSIGPTNSLRASLHCAIDYILALHIVYSYSAMGLSRLLVRLSGIGAVISITLLVAFPDLGHEVAGGDYAGAWRGAYENKNFLGAIASIAVIAAAYSALAGANRRWLATLVMLANLGLLLGSRSTTAIVATGVCLPILFIAFTFRKPGGSLFTAVVALGCVCLLVAALMSVRDPFALLGKDSTLTGRTAVWHAVIPLVRQRLFLGYGIGFWDTDSDSRNDVWSAANWNAPHSHNDYLDLVLQTGAFSLLLAVSNYLFCICLGLWSLWRVREGFVLYLVLIVNFMVRSLTETMTTSPATPQLALLYAAEMSLWLLTASPRAATARDGLIAYQPSTTPSRACDSQVQTG